MSDIFLSKDDLLVLTGHVRPKEQIEWLRQNGWVHIVGGNGRPIVHKEFAKQLLTGEIARPKVKVEPNFDAIA